MYRVYADYWLSKIAISYIHRQTMISIIGHTITIGICLRIVPQIGDCIHTTLSPYTYVQRDELGTRSQTILEHEAPSHYHKTFACP